MIENDYDVKITDANFYDLTITQFKKLITEFKSDVVGIPILTPEYTEI